MMAASFELFRISLPFHGPLPSQSTSRSASSIAAHISLLESGFVVVALVPDHTPGHAALLCAERELREKRAAVGHLRPPNFVMIFAWEDARDGHSRSDSGDRLCASTTAHVVMTLVTVAPLPCLTRAPCITPC